MEYQSNKHTAICIAVFIFILFAITKDLPKAKEVWTATFGTIGIGVALYLVTRFDKWFKKWGSRI